jgi:NAD(P)-dependent dehydrogenase (short-subunit alcohol dehydrogenase family)
LPRLYLDVYTTIKLHYHWQELKNSLKGCSGTLYAVKADVSKEEEIVALFKWIKKNLGGVDVLINNAGITGKSTVHGKRHKALISHIYVGMLSYVLRT